jgi:hypothetical protein
MLDACPNPFEIPLEIRHFCFYGRTAVESIAVPMIIKVAVASIWKWDEGELPMSRLSKIGNLIMKFRKAIQDTFDAIRKE